MQAHAAPCQAHAVPCGPTHTYLAAQRLDFVAQRLGRLAVRQALAVEALLAVLGGLGEGEGAGSGGDTVRQLPARFQTRAWRSARAAGRPATTCLSAVPQAPPHGHSP